MPAVDGLAMYDETQRGLTSIQVEEYAPLVKRIAHHMMMRMPACVQVEDLIQDTQKDVCQSMVKCLVIFSLSLTCHYLEQMQINVCH